MSEAEFPLFERYPNLEPAFPRVELTRLPSPVHRLEHLGRTLGTARLWIKRDDQSGLWHGGNKPRKLEFLLGEALVKGANTVITFGTLGTHHGLATAICAQKVGLQCVLVLVDEPVREETRKNLLLCHAFGARLCYAGTHTKAYLLGAWQLVRHFSLRRRRLPYLIMPGGSTPLGALGYVNAALELEEQVKAGLLPAPDYIFVAVGSNGTMAGLLAGLRLTQLPTRVMGVRVSDQVRITPGAVATLANRALGLLRRVEPALSGVEPIRPQEVHLVEGYLGAGYAHPTPEAERAIRLMADCERITLEGVYTGKTLAALIDLVQQPKFQTSTILFWNTYNSLPLEGIDWQALDPRALPPAFQRFFRHQVDL